MPPKIGAPRLFPRLPDTDALIAELRARLTKIEDKLDRALDALKARDDAR